MFHLLLSFFLSYYAGKAVLKCSGGTDCFRSGVAVPAQPGNVDCGLNRSATEGGDVVLDSSVLFASGGHERQVVNTVHIDGLSDEITCTINGTIGSCNGDVGIRIVEDSIEEGGALNISLTLQDVTLEHSGGYTVRVIASTLNKTSEISEQCLRYHLTVDGTFDACFAVVAECTAKCQPYCSL